uniref:Uncharacterized protein n=1 Tax=Arundo donax TaxID=35708 RepID=A0A0A9F9E2_ARUDO
MPFYMRLWNSVFRSSYECKPAAVFAAN